MAGAAVVGVDLGTSSLKVVALDGDGGVLARARADYPTHRPEPGAAEQEPADWWRALDQALRELGREVAADRWCAIGLSGMLPTLVGLDRDAQPIGRALTWQDARADADGERYRESAGTGLYARTGQWVDGRYLVPMMTRLAAQGAPAADAEWLCGAKDALFAHLTGQPATDPSTASGYGCYDLSRGRWDEAIAPARWRLPEVLPSTTARPLRCELAAAWRAPQGLPVVLGAADSVLGAYALGIDAPGEVAYLAGTSTVILGRVEASTRDPAHRFLVTPLAAGGYGAEMDLLATGSALAWLAALLGLAGPGELARLAADVPPPAAPVMLAYLAPGEQGALWDPTLTGALTGLHLGTTRGQLARALRTAIVAESARCVAVLGQLAPGSASGEVAMAGAALDRGFAQDLADATGRPVRLHTDEPDQSAVGAARLAATAVGIRLPALGTGAVALAPDPDAAGMWRQLAARQDATRAALFGARPGGSGGLRTD